VLCAWEDEEVKNDTPDLGGPRKGGCLIKIKAELLVYPRSVIMCIDLLYIRIRSCMTGYALQEKSKRRVKKKKVGDAC